MRAPEMRAQRETRTRHSMRAGDARDLRAIPGGSVRLVVTSPPYPMIEMWDAAFAALDPEIGEALGRADGMRAFERMHAVLDAAWREVGRVLAPGGIACINIGDATRTMDGSFALYPNHARILSQLAKLGFTVLPGILWRKPTNAPNKFLGSGMLPAGAYVTLEHEHVLIVRKGPKREFTTPASRLHRNASALFWEERNHWYSDVWFGLRGAGQGLDDTSSRERSGAFPFELPYRLIQMFSVKGDRVLDPFAGLGTTLLAAIASARDSVGVEIDPELASTFARRLDGLRPIANARVTERLRAHVDFVAERIAAKKPLKHVNAHYGFPVITRQERELVLERLLGVDALDALDDGSFEARHEPLGKNAIDSRPRARSAELPLGPGVN